MSTPLARFAQSLSLPSQPIQKAEEPAGITIPGLPKDLMGPTGRVFVHPGGDQVSTELTSTFEIGGKYYNVPLLVPEQVGIADLLAGKPPTQEQRDRAIRYMQQQPGFAGYSSEDEALAVIRARHQRIEQELAPLISQYLRGHR